MAESLTHVVANLGRPRVLVLGDLILDRYVWGDAERISQEAPVILLRAHDREDRLGGAASVASMLAALGAQVSLAGVVGADLAGQQTRHLLDSHGIDHDSVVSDADRPTTLKERYMGRAQQKHPQQMLRVDYEVRQPIAEPIEHRLAAAIESRFIDFDIIVVSDYDKGVCTPTLVRRLIEKGRERSVRVLVDPIRGGNYAARYRRAHCMTPNRLEASLATEIPIECIDSAFAAAAKLKELLELEASIITLDRDGMVLVDQQGGQFHFPCRPREVYDITGAGDMVLSVLGMVLAAGFSYPEAIRLANVAGGLEVERVGVATLTRADLLQDIHHDAAAPLVKRLPENVLVDRISQLVAQGQHVVVVHLDQPVIAEPLILELTRRKKRGQQVVVLEGYRVGSGDAPDSESGFARILEQLPCIDYLVDRPHNPALLTIVSALASESVRATSSGMEEDKANKRVA